MSIFDHHVAHCAVPMEYVCTVQKSTSFVTSTTVVEKSAHLKFRCSTVLLFATAGTLSRPAGSMYEYPIDGKIEPLNTE